MPIIALNHALNEALTHCTSFDRGMRRFTVMMIQFTWSPR
jgi:hypothetical protein